MEYYAHSLEGKPPSQWQKLEDHLKNVADRAAEFARPFGGEQWAFIAGLWHDVGKYSNEFQKMLLEANGFECHLETRPGKPIHSLAGGHLAQQVMSHGVERIFCWLIMGHHAGLADFSSADSGAKALEPKMRNPNLSSDIILRVPETIRSQPSPEIPSILKKGGDVAFFIRMLFSCLVDADFLDTERFMDANRASLREKSKPTLEQLLGSFDHYMESLCQQADETEVNALRADVLRQCRCAAEWSPGVFSLTVPTGGGKTLASMAFALRHAVRYKKQRIIYVIPYTSIIEQTAAVFRSIPGFDEAVLEHHSNILDDDESRETVRRRLATENWDAPIIITTSVQFFESLYSSKTSCCRKLHNIVNSVVIFDEAQCLPPKYLRPIVFAIRELCRHYHVTSLLCTATQPVLTQAETFDFRFREAFEPGSVREIINEPKRLFKKLERVHVETLDSLAPVSLEIIADRLREENSPVLCIVNSKLDARRLAQLLPQKNTVHLSTNMIPAHRLERLKYIREHLQTGTEEPFYVVSTSLVEAGVDLDFPVVYRALAGLDSIAQAAGRCNREGRLSRGRTVIFTPERQPGYVRSPASLARNFLRPEKLGDIFLPETFNDYFRLRFFQLGDEALDQHGILACFPDRKLEYAFRKAAEQFHIIDDTWHVPLIIPIDEASELLSQLFAWDVRAVFRKLQHFTIQIPKFVMDKMLVEGHAKELSDYPGTFYLTNPGLYTKDYGFVPPDELDAYDTNVMIV